MRSKGFTLVELLISISIISILVVVAFPTYQDYSIRSRVVEGLTKVSAAKMAVAETSMQNNALPADQEATGYISPQATANVSSITIGRQGIITISYIITAGGGTILLQPTLQANGDITWTCTGGTLARKYRPPTCQP